MQAIQRLMAHILEASASTPALIRHCRTESIRVSHRRKAELNCVKTPFSAP